ncbi:hypothetical protein JCM8547_005488 [Rhodosporidiobolus lusitaniae]
MHPRSWEQAVPSHSYGHLPPQQPVPEQRGAYQYEQQQYGDYYARQPAQYEANWASEYGREQVGGLVLGQHGAGAYEGAQPQHREHQEHHQAYSPQQQQQFYPPPTSSSFPSGPPPETYERYPLPPQLDYAAQLHYAPPPSHLAQPPPAHLHQPSQPIPNRFLPPQPLHQQQHSAPPPPQPNPSYPTLSRPVSNASLKRRRVSFAAPSPSPNDSPSSAIFPPLPQPVVPPFADDSSLPATPSAAVLEAARRASIATTAGGSGLSAASTPAAPPAGAQLAGRGGGAEVDGEVQVKSEEKKVELADKSCKNCRARKVRCSRTWPSCARCQQKKLDCTYGNLIPIELAKNMNPDSRVAELEAKIKTLELELASSHSQSQPQLPSHPPLIPSSSSSSSSHTSPHTPTLSRRIFTSLLSRLPSSSFSPASKKRAHVEAVLHSVLARANGRKNAEGSSAVGRRECDAEAGDEVEDEQQRMKNAGMFGPPTGKNAGGGASWPVQAADEEREEVEQEADEVADEEQYPMKLVWVRWTSAVRADAETARAMLAELEERFGATGEEGVVKREDGDEVERELEMFCDSWIEKEEWARWVVWGCMDALWSTCSSNTPTFLPLHHPLRKLRLYVSLLPPSSPSSSRRTNPFLTPTPFDTYDGPPTAPESVIICALVVLGQRGSLDLPFFFLSSPSSSTTAASPATEPSLAVRRELQSRSVRALMLEMYDSQEVAHGEGTVAALEASLIAGAIMIWNELLPRRSRSLVRASLGQFKDVLDAAQTPDEKKNLIMTYALPLLVQDSTTSAYLRSSPLITSSDLATYFAALPLPSFEPSSAKSASLTAPPTAPSSLIEDVAEWVDLDRLEGADHMQLLMGSMVVWKWLAGCLRFVAEMSCPKSLSSPLCPSSLSTLLNALTSIHAALHTFQRHFTHLPHAHVSCLAPGPEGDTCQTMHLRWTTRLDREVDDAVWLVYGAVEERMVREAARAEADGEREEDVEGEVEGQDGEEEVVGAETGRLDVGWLRMVEGRVRKGLKLAAFYFNFFLTSPDPHQTHHLAWSLELIPSWTFLATQRYSPSTAPPSTYVHASATSTLPGLASKADELTETELDWIERGLESAVLYHPVAERRLIELRAYRAGNERRKAEGDAPNFPSRATPTLDSSDYSFSPAVRVPNKKAGERQLSFQDAMKVALKMRVPAWA